MPVLRQERGRPLLIQPINAIFRYLQTHARVKIWLYTNTSMKLEGHIIGFDEYMNLVLDDAEEVFEKKGKRVKLGRIMLKGENITLIQNACPPAM